MFSRHLSIKGSKVQTPDVRKSKIRFQCNNYTNRIVLVSELGNISTHPLIFDSIGVLIILHHWRDLINAAVYSLLK